MNNMIKILLVTFSISFPSTVFGGIGDVYYCSMKNFIVIKNFKVTEYPPQKFKFKITNSGLTFGSEKGFFENFFLSEKLFSSEDVFDYRMFGSYFRYEKGIFHFSQVNYDNVISFSGTCENF